MPKIKATTPTKTAQPSAARPISIPKIAATTAPKTAPPSAQMAIAITERIIWSPNIQYIQSRKQVKICHLNIHHQKHNDVELSHFDCKKKINLSRLFCGTASKDEICFALFVK